MNSMAEHPEDHYTIRVGNKTIDINRKTGDWKEVDSTAVTEGEWDKTEKGWEFTPEGGRTTSAGRPRLGEQVLDEISSGTQTSGVIDDPQVLSEITLGEAEQSNTATDLGLAGPRPDPTGDLSDQFEVPPIPPVDTTGIGLPIGAPEASAEDQRGFRDMDRLLAGRGHTPGAPASNPPIPGRNIGPELGSLPAGQPLRRSPSVPRVPPE